MAKKVEREQDVAEASQNPDPVANSPAVVGGQNQVLRDADVVVVGADGFSQTPNFQAELSGEGVDTVPREAVEAANKARLARGDDPVVPDNVSVNQSDLRQNPVPDELDGVGEDTQAVRQSSNVRVVDGRKFVRHDPDTGKIS